ETRRPQGGHHAVHDAVHVRRHPHDRGLVLPGPGIQLGVALEPGVVLRVMTAALALSTNKIAALVAVGVLVLFMALLSSSFIRARRNIAAQTMEREGQTPPTEPKPSLMQRLRPGPRKPPPAVTRREFFRRSLVGSLLVFGAEFGGASLAFLWPNLAGGFGSVISAGTVTD